MRRVQQKAVSGVTATVIAFAAVILIALAEFFFTMELIYAKRVEIEKAGFLIPAILLLAVLIGGLVGHSLEGRRGVSAAIVPAGILAILLLIMWLLTDGSLQVIGYNVAGIGAGAIASYAICLRKIRKTRARKFVHR